MIIKKAGDFWMSLVLLGLSAVLYHQSLQIDDLGFLELGPTVFPSFFIGVLAALSLLLLFGSISLKGEREVSGKVDRKVFLMRGVFYGMLIVYLVVMPYVGYIVSTALFLFCGMVLLGRRTAKDLALYAVISAVGTGVLYALFGVLLKLFLP